MPDENPDSRTNRRRFARLLVAMAATDVPTARPNLARHDETTGLTLLSLALRLNHVNRVTESLKLINIDHLSRTVNVDIDLRNLTEQQRQSVAVHEATPTTHAAGTGTASRFGTAPRLWIPISRHSREDLAPVVVRDADGTVVPRLTQAAATSAITAGVTWLFRTHLKEQDEAEESYERIHQARWLIEVAIANLIEQGLHGARPASWPEPRQGTVHRLAEEYIERLDTNISKHLADLLIAASQEYFLIVMLSTEQSHQFLTYDAPLIPAVRSSTARRRAWRSLLPVSTEFTVNYVTQLPRTVGSYHVTIDVPEEIDVRRFILSSDADHAAVENLASRLEALAAVSGNHDRIHSRLIRTEQKEVEGALGVLGQRRQLDLEGFDYYLRNRELLQAARFRQVARTRRGVAPLARLLGTRSENHGNDLQLRSASLCEQASQLRQSQLGLDVSTDNDPRENGAHAQWRPVPMDFGHPTIEPVEARVYLAMADEPPALVESVAWMIGALLLVVLGLGYIAQLDGKTDQAARQADAVVAVLLIVPGILLSRLDIPATHSVLGRLRRFPRMVAYLSVVVTTGLAMVVAVGDDTPETFVACGVMLFVLLLLCFVEIFSRSLRRKVLVPASATLPPWLRNEFDPRWQSAGAIATGWVRRKRIHPPDVYFDAIRPVPNTTRVASLAYERRAAQRRRVFAGEAPVATEGPALLADLGSRALAGSYTGVWLEIAHGYSGIPQTSPSYPDPDEFLFTSFHGVTSQMSSGYSQADRPEFLHRAPDAAMEAPDGQIIRWLDEAPFKPAAIRQNMNDVDFLVEFSADPSCMPSDNMLSLLSAIMRPAESRQAHYGAETESNPHAGPVRAPEQGIAHTASAVPSFVLAPAAMPVRSQKAIIPSPALGSSMRISFTLPHSDHAGRLALEQRMVSLAHAQQIRLWRASRRPGAGHGDWQLVNDADLAPQACRTTGHDRRTVVIPLTFVAGPGLDNAAGLHALTGVLQKRNACIASVSASAVTEFAVVQVLLRGNAAAFTIAAGGRTKWTVSDIVAELTERGVLEGGIPGDDVEPLGMDVYVGEPRSVQTASRNGHERCALWVDWELPARAVSQQILAKHLLGAAQVVGLEEPEIVHWRVSRTHHDKVRGRAKLAVELPVKNQDGSGLGEMAKVLQTDVIARLTRSEVLDPTAKETGGGCESASGEAACHNSRRVAETAQADSHTLPRHAVFLHVAWSEPWLKRRRGV